MKKRSTIDWAAVGDKVATILGDSLDDIEWVERMARVRGTSFVPFIAAAITEMIREEVEGASPASGHNEREWRPKGPRR